MEINTDNYISATFLEAGRDNIEVLVRSDDGKKVIPHIIKYDERHPDCQQLLKIVNVDQLHENTNIRVKDERAKFEEQVMAIAKKDGLVFDKGTHDSKFFPTLVRGLFDNGHNEDHLFAIKLALFEYDPIRDSDNKEAKDKIRAGTTKAEVIAAAIELLAK
tara:strand:+ start:14199 stop:14681 length:483 start_codon:yes stop_codon:yes gene_type:complete